MRSSALFYHSRSLRERDAATFRFCLPLLPYGSACRCYLTVLLAAATLPFLLAAATLPILLAAATLPFLLAVATSLFLLCCRHLAVSALLPRRRPQNPDFNVI
ncbi:hypothetical protein LJX78_04575 [Methanimicrococcus blatticola]|uniref:hypothetical protein n=1 Tax=Methanimicrococcus blatticola TaxID=91560 RepID=UPI001E50547D|nr:hypothetical protein [Methanimicrococcus blatticola]MCC2508884.1 hypothetical protein [Methanimicrococcus blatticola]